MSAGLIFAGNGGENVRGDVGALANVLMDRLTAVAGITGRPVVLVGGVVDGRLIVERILREGTGDHEIAAGTRLEFANVPRGAFGSRVWGLSLESTTGEIEIWRHGPVELEPFVVAALDAEC